MEITRTSASTKANASTNTNASKGNKRLENAQARNERRLASTKSQIEQATSNEQSIINIKAIEIMQILKKTKDINNKTVLKDMYLIAIVLCQSKLKRLNSKDSTYNEHNAQLKAEIYHATNNESNGLKYQQLVDALNNLYMTEYDKNGNAITVCTDKKQASDIEKRLAKLTDFDNASDILQSAICKLWQYINKAIEQGLDNIQDSYLLDAFAVVIPSSTIYKNGNKKPCELWQYKYTNAIKETSIEISRQIEKMKAFREQEKVYVPLHELEQAESEYNEQDENGNTRYKQASKLALIPTYDCNGKQITTTSDYATERLINNIIQKANFTKRQLYIFKHYFINQDMSILEISDKLKVTERYIEQEIKKIRVKCVNTKLLAVYGYNASDLDRLNNEQKKQAIICYMLLENGNTKQIAEFESIGQASKILNISKGNISKVLKNQRKQANGYIFKYAIA